MKKSKIPFKSLYILFKEDHYKYIIKCFVTFHLGVTSLWKKSSKLLYSNYIIFWKNT